MKKTVTVNLSGTVYNIDEDAYALLDSYLKNLRVCFKREVDGEEIVRDMEARIAELLNEDLGDKQTVITIENVEKVIGRMGKPEDFSDEDADADGKRSWAGDKSTTMGKRLFRNPDDRILGGVLSGIAAYFGINATLLRLLLLVAVFFVHVLILIYIILWIVIPLARTATEKLQMRGKPINMENIGKTVTEGVDKVGEKVNAGKTKSFLHSLGNGIVEVVGFLIKFLLVLLAVCLTPALLFGLIVVFILLVVAVGVAGSVPVMFFQLWPEVDWNIITTVSPALTLAFSVCAVLALGIPVLALLQILMQAFGGWKPMSTGVRVFLILLWMVSLALGIALFLQYPLNFYV